MKIVAGVDIGNSTTEVCIARIMDNKQIQFLATAETRTIGVKGTLDNTQGIKNVLAKAIEQTDLSIKDIDVLLLNEATPVMGDTAMETITQTVIRDSSMIGHNPSTPAGVGVATGILVSINNLDSCDSKDYIVMAVDEDYETVSKIINNYSGKINIKGLMLKKDEGVLVYNRLVNKIPIVDEISKLSTLEQGRICAIEVANHGESIKVLSNPYGIATLLELNSDETKNIMPIAKSLIGKRSAIVIKTENQNIDQTILKAGKLTFYGENIIEVDVDNGAEIIMKQLETVGFIESIEGEENTNIGIMLDRMKTSIKAATNNSTKTINIKDILAVDTFAPVKISGGIADEICMEKAVGIAAMVKTDKLNMVEIAEKIAVELGIYTKVAGVEAVMAAIGSLTTPGVSLPLAILDLGGGSTDGAIIYSDGVVKSTHLAGAGELVTMIIATELNIRDKSVAELIKKYPVAKVESLFQLRLENGDIKFFTKPFEPKYFGNIVVLKNDEYVLLELDVPLNRISSVRREAKEKVFVTNSVRALKSLCEDNLRDIPNVVLVGGSAQDFEIPEMLTESFAEYKIVCGRANIRKQFGARNAVATGLALSYL